MSDKYIAGHFMPANVPLNNKSSTKWTSPTAFLQLIKAKAVLTRQNIMN